MGFASEFLFDSVFSETCLPELNQGVYFIFLTGECFNVETSFALEFVY